MRDSESTADRLRQARRNRKATDSGTGTQPGVGVQVEDFHAYMVEHNYIFAPARQMWPAGSVNARIPPINVGTDKNGEPVILKANVWLDRIVRSNK